jgi:hypothetical protein
MKRQYCCILALTVLAVMAARGTDVQWSYGDFSQVPQTRRPLIVYPLIVNATNAAGVTTGDWIVRTTGADGTATISNMLPGWVRAEFWGINKVSTNWYQIPDTNVLVFACNCLQTNFFVGGPLPLPAPWWGKAELVPGTNTTFRTNSGKVFIDTEAGGPGGGQGMGAFITNGESSVQFESISAPGTGTALTLTAGAGNNGNTGGGNLVLSGGGDAYNPGVVDVISPLAVNELSTYYQPGLSVINIWGSLSIGDAVTPMAISLGYGDTSPFSVDYSGGVHATSYYGLPAAPALPFVVVYPGGKYLANGVTITASGTQTAAIQEAINALPAGGGEVVLSPGVYYMTAGINVPGLFNQGYGLVMVGAGMSRSCIVYAGSVPSYTLKVGSPDFGNATVFCMRHLCVASCNNATTNIVWLEGSHSSATNNNGGGLAAADIEGCWIGYWPSMTNNAGGDFTPSGIPDSVKHDLIGLDVNLMFNNLVWIRGNQISYCLVGLSISCDHPSIEHNTYNFCGDNASQPNDWPAATSWSLGAGLNLYHGHGFAVNTTTTHSWRCCNNSYIGGGALTATPAIVIDHAKDWLIGWNWTFEYENFEWPSGSPLIATTSLATNTFVNPMGYHTDTWASYPKYAFTNLTNFTGWRGTPASAANIRTWDWNAAQYDMTMNALRTTNAPQPGYLLRVDGTGTNLYYAPN